MPDLHILPAFILASVALMLLPGPNVALIVANSVAYGARWGLLTVIATSSASMVQLTLVSIGMASAVEQLGGWFSWFRWAGVAYLILIGIQQWRTMPVALDGVHAQLRSARSIFLRAVIVSITNPKTLLFYAAFFPQFIDPSRPPAAQFVILALLFLAMAVTVDSAWAFSAAKVRVWLGNHRGRLFNRASGVVLVSAGIGLALDRSR